MSSSVLTPADESARRDEHRLAFIPSPKRVRVVVNGKTVADSLCAGLLFESGHFPVYYFPREDICTDLIERTSHHTHCPYKGEASYWALAVGNRRYDNALWSYEAPPAEIAGMSGWLAFDPEKVDHWYEEDEEIFGHPRDPHHRIDVRRSGRRVRVRVGGEIIAETQDGLFLFETDIATRYYFPPQDVRMELLEPSHQVTICPYKGRAAHWSLRLGERTVANIAWSYPKPLPECARIKDHLAFYPEKVDSIEVEGETQPGAKLG